MATEKLKIECAVPDFFRIPMKKVVIEAAPNTGRTYFIHAGAIVAVARRGGENSAIS